MPADTQPAARELRYVPKSPAVTFNRFAACSKETEIENRTNRIDIMQAEADQYTLYLRQLQSTDEEARAFLHLCDKRKREVSHALFDCKSWHILVHNIISNRH